MSYRILIVDDSPAMRSFVRRVIHLSGVDVEEFREASNGARALDILREHPVDLVLTDVNMPEVDGEQFLERLAEDDRLKGIPVIVISTDATQNRISRLIKLGARGYLAKPFLPEVLRAQLEGVLETIRV